MHCTATSIPGQGEIYMANSISALLSAHSVVTSRQGLYVVDDKVARGDWPTLI